jgi:hypothetical protein
MTAVVLGMTPELRNLAAQTCKQLVTIEKNQDAVSIYADWLQEELREKETIVRGDWFDLPDFLQGEPGVILGDGVFGNLRCQDDHVRLLRILRTCLSRHGRFITRKACIPHHFDEDAYNHKLIQDYRKGELTDNEFGFCMRMLGFHSVSYDQPTCILDNGLTYHLIKQLYTEGKLTKQEFELTMRFYFPGDNCIVPQKDWERMLMDSGFIFESSSLSGRLWYTFYKVYSCWAR